MEKETQRDVLCPIALNDSWKTCDWEGPLRKQIQKYNILDFSEWRSEERLKEQFGKLKDGLQVY